MSELRTFEHRAGLEFCTWANGAIFIQKDPAAQVSCSCYKTIGTYNGRPFDDCAAFDSGTFMNGHIVVPEIVWS